jgi:hypothetical protein
MQNNAICKITKIEEVVTIGTVLERHWFRGHPKIYKYLDPRVFRDIYSDELYRRMRPDREYAVVEEFKLVTPSLYSNIPGKEDDLEWLVLMQHYGVPTRLLDWTESILIALYFAVKDFPKDDGEIWTLYPSALNKKGSGFWGMPTLKNPFLQYLAKEANYDKEDKKLEFAKKIGLPGIPKSPVAFYPILNFIRMVVQSSTFTIHPFPKNGSRIEDILKEEKYLFRYVIPAEYKKCLLQNLNSLGIKNYKIFPDLDHFAQDIISESNILAYTPKEPPKFNN